MVFYLWLAFLKNSFISNYQNAETEMYINVCGFGTFLAYYGCAKHVSGRIRKWWLKLAPSKSYGFCSSRWVLGNILCSSSWNQHILFSFLHFSLQFTLIERSDHCRCLILKSLTLPASIALVGNGKWSYTISLKLVYIFELYLSVLIFFFKL